MAVPQIQNQLGKSMIGHITLALTVGGTAAFSFWYGHVVPARNYRAQYYAEDRLRRAA
ncbi:hypothetical protein BGZ73_003964 [Actinomortierella ambigua]|nr:hypothetical protein BGZ73_003964 [Actinomortierella ambigua]